MGITSASFMLSMAGFEALLDAAALGAAALDADIVVGNGVRNRFCNTVA